MIIRFLIRPTKDSVDAARVSALKLRNHLFGVFLERLSLKGSKRWRKAKMTVEFDYKVSQDAYGITKVEVANMTISENGVARKRSPDSMDGVDISKFIKTLKDL